MERGLSLRRALLFITIIYFVNICSGRIPEQLIKCYLHEEYPPIKEMPPLKIQLLIELLRKIEQNEIMARDIRIFSSILYHR